MKLAGGSAEPARVTSFLFQVLRNLKSDKKQDRALRLQQEAANCLAIALTTREPEFAAALIDEALKLVRRSQQMIGADLAA